MRVLGMQEWEENNEKTERQSIFGKEGRKEGRTEHGGERERERMHHSKQMERGIEG